MMSTPEQKPRGDLAALRIEREPEAVESTFQPGKLLGWAGILIVLAVVGWLVYDRLVVPRRAPVVEMMTIKPTIHVVNQATLTASGYLVADKQAVISPKMSGRVVRLNFDVGSKVSAGDVLAILESDELEAQLQEANAGYADAARELTRQRALYQEGVTSRALLDSADAQADVARARVSRLRVNLRDMVVRAPFSGTIISKNVEVGEIVSPISMGTSTGGAGSIAALTDLRTIEVEADVNEGNLAQLRLGHPAEVSVDAFPGRKWRGRLRQIVPTADRAKGSVKVKVAILDVSEQLLPDMSASASFLQTERTAGELSETAKIWIPASALANDGSGGYVMVIGSDNRVSRRSVTAGENRDGRVEVTNGLTDGMKIVTKDPASLDEGQLVRLPQA